MGGKGEGGVCILSKIVTFYVNGPYKQYPTGFEAYDVLCAL